MKNENELKEIDIKNRVCYMSMKYINENILNGSDSRTSETLLFDIFLIIQKIHLIYIPKLIILSQLKDLMSCYHHLVFLEHFCIEKYLPNITI